MLKEAVLQPFLIKSSLDSTELSDYRLVSHPFLGKILRCAVARIITKEIRSWSRGVKRVSPTLERLPQGVGRYLPPPFAHYHSCPHAFLPLHFPPSVSIIRVLQLPLCSPCRVSVFFTAQTQPLVPLQWLKSTSTRQRDRHAHTQTQDELQIGSED